MYEELAMLFARRFIQRRDVKAIQLAFPDKVIYTPDIKLENPGRYGPIGFGMNHLYQHLRGEATYGHYLLDNDSKCRMFAFDIDLEKEGFYLPDYPFQEGMDEKAWEAYVSTPIPFNPRDSWPDRSHAGRAWLKSQMGTLARRFCAAIEKEAGLPCAAAYSGSKGIHVYGFTKQMPAQEVRNAAIYILESMDDWTLYRGQSIYQHKIEDPNLGYRNFTVEVFPKQESLDGKDLGNLMRLPLGRNLKSNDPCFFLDLTTPIGVMAPHPDPVRLLDTGKPFA